MLAIERACLRALFELDQLETDWIGCIETRDPEAIAGAYRLLGHHMQATMQYIGITGAITESELATGPNSANARGFKEWAHVPIFKENSASTDQHG